VIALAWSRRQLGSPARRRDLLRIAHHRDLAALAPADAASALAVESMLMPSLRAQRSNPESKSEEELDCFVAEPVIGRACAL